MNAKWLSLRGRHREPPTHLLTRRIFLGSLGLIYALAFASLGTQILGLAGSQGIEPVARLLELSRNASWPARLARLPTVFWISHSDTALQVVCWTGVGAGLLLAIDRLPLLAAIVAWVLYLSLQASCGIFLHYQWDILLLETGFLAIFEDPQRR